MKTKDTSEVLLIHPPSRASFDPYISIPVLVSYLRSRDISVSAYDLEREFYVKLLTPQNILKGLTYCRERFLELNNKAKLNFQELFEYKILAITLSEAQTFKQHVEKLLFPFAGFADIQNSPALCCFVRAATFPYFPEMIIPEYQYFNMSSYSPFTTSDFVKSCTHKSFQTQLYKEIIQTEIVSKYSPRIIGFSVTFSTQIVPAFQCAHIVKQHLPDVHVTMGGPFISVFLREIHAHQLFDIVDSFILDEGEIPLETLVQELSSQQPDLSRVPALIYRENGHICFNPPPPPLDIELSPPPDYTVFELDKYLYSRDRLMVPFRLSKGCPWQKCTFCRTDLPFCRNYQALSKEGAYHQLLHVIKTAGLSNFLFSDENADPETLEYLSQRLLEDEIELQWTAHTRVSKQLTRQRCELYRKAGCTTLKLGIEALSDRILKLMKKGISVKMTEEVLRDIAGTIPLIAYMIVGFPTETEEEALAGFKMLEEFRSRKLIRMYSYNVLHIIYGSDIWKNPQNYGISEIYMPENFDLYGDTIHFNCSTGMPGEKAFDLALEFNRHADPFRGFYSLRQLSFNKKIIPLRYDLEEIDRVLIIPDLYSSIYLPFIPALYAAEGEIYPSSNVYK